MTMHMYVCVYVFVFFLCKRYVCVCVLEFVSVVKSMCVQPCSNSSR